MADFADKFYRDLGLSFSKSAIDTTSGSTDIGKSILQDRKLNENDDLNPDGSIKTLKNFTGSISISIDKANTSFDFAEHFKAFLNNNEFKKNTQLINFIEDSSNELGKVIYERIQNFLNNYINVDSCHYKVLLDYYTENSIDIETYLTKNIPAKIDYLLNIFSVSKLYLKNGFYDLSIYDSSITDAIANVSGIESLNEAEKLLNEKYFGNFYSSVVFPIIKNELYDNYEDKEIQDYILASTNKIYDNCLEGSNSEYIFLMTLKNILSEDTLKVLSISAKEKFLEQYPEFSENESAEISDDHFYQLVTKFPSNEYLEDGTLPTVDLTNYFKVTSGSIDSLDITIYQNPNYKEALEIIERSLITRSEFVKLLRIKTCAQKLSNICNSLCKLREEIKLIRVKDSKIGTAVLIEELIMEYIFKKLTKKVGITNQGKIPNNFAGFKEYIEAMNDSELKSSLQEIAGLEQTAIGIKFEDRFNTLKALAATLDAEIIEYIDTTPTYLNINPSNSIEEKVYYKEEETVYPPYLNVNGLTVYPDFNNKNKSSFSNQSEIYQYSDSTSGTTQYYIRGNLCQVNKLGQIVLNGQIYYTPINSNIFVVAPNMSKSTYNENTKLYKLSPTEVVDRYDRIITYTHTQKLIDNNGSPVMQWVNDIYIGNTANFLITEGTGYFTEYNSKLTLALGTGSNASWYGLYKNYSTGELSNTSKTGYDFIQMFKVAVVNDLTQVVEIKSGVYLQYMSGIIIDTNMAYYQMTSEDTYVLKEDNTELKYSSNKELYNPETKEILNNYSEDLEKFYAIENKKTVIANKEKTITTVLKGNTPFWDNLSTTSLYEDKTVDEERDIIRFYKSIGLINETLDDNYKSTSKNGVETLSTPWMLAREKIINKLKAAWIANAPHRWYDPLIDDARLADGKITENIALNLKEMDTAYSSVLGQSYAKQNKKALNNSVVNLENWENNTVAIHPCIWNLIEKSYTEYLQLITISLYGEDILKKIYTEARDWDTRESHTSPEDKDGAFSLNIKNSNPRELHIIDYWKNYNKTFFPYSTEYELSNHENYAGNITSRYLGFDGPFNYEALKDVIDKYWTTTEEVDPNSIRNICLNKYYIDVDQ